MIPALTKSEVQRRFPKYFRFHLLVLQGPFTRWINNKLKWYTSHLYFTFTKSRLFNPWEKSEISNAKTERWLCPQEDQEPQTIYTLSMTWISNLFLRLVEMTRFQKIIMVYGHEIPRHIKRRLTFEIFIYR